jgi:hypothetical protein
MNIILTFIKNTVKVVKKCIHVLGDLYRANVSQGHSEIVENVNALLNGNIEFLPYF